MREVIIRVTCDFCQEVYPDDEMHAITLTTSNVTHEGDACPPCYANLVTVMRPVKKDGEYACAKCGRAFAREANRDKHQDGCKK